MFLFTNSDRLRFDAAAVVADNELEVSYVGKIQSKFARARVHTGVTNGFVANAVRLLSRNWMKFPNTTSDRCFNSYRLTRNTFFCNLAQIANKIVCLNRRCTERLQGCATFTAHAIEPTGQALQNAAHDNRIVRILEPIFSHHSASLKCL